MPDTTSLDRELLENSEEKDLIEINRVLGDIEESFYQESIGENKESNYSSRTGSVHA